MTIEEVKSLLGETVPNVEIRNYHELESKEPIKCKGYSDRGICVLGYDGRYDISIRISFIGNKIGFHLECAGHTRIRKFSDASNVNISTYRYFIEVIQSYTQCMDKIYEFDTNKIPIQIIRNTTIESLIN